jgi:uncharacterized protein
VDEPTKLSVHTKVLYSEVDLQALRTSLRSSVGSCSDADMAAVTTLLERRPKTVFHVVVRRPDGLPVVTRNAPFEDDGTPMPTLFWLLPSALASSAIGHIEASGGVRLVEHELGFDRINAIHERYAAERDLFIPADWNGPLPTGGVGGTRRGCKCLHAHYAYFLSGAEDAVGEWVFEKLEPSVRDVRVVRQ